MMLMSLSIDDQRFIESMVDRYGITEAWKRILAARLMSAGENYSYVLQSESFQKIEPAMQDILAHMTIGEVSVAYEYALAYNDRASRKREGQFFTPDDVAQFLARQEQHFDQNLVWVDP